MLYIIDYTDYVSDGLLQVSTLLCM